MKNYIVLIVILQSIVLFSQKDSTAFTYQLYGELYYSYDFSEPENHQKPNFLYNHKRHNEVNLNLALAKVSYQKNNIRGNVGIMFGNYVEYNLAAETEVAKHIYEANLGVKLSKQHSIWVDAGILPSHIGFESAIGADCWTLSRSMLAENSPYFETGIKASYQSKNEKLYAGFLYLNGWQRIQKPDKMQKPSFGTQITYKPNSKWLLNYSTFFGSDKLDSLQSFRSFHNVYAIYQLGSFGITAGFDIGTEKSKNSKNAVWYSPVCIVKYGINERFSTAFRAEYYEDNKQVLITTDTPNGFKTFGFSANVDYKLSNNIVWRIEGKKYLSKDEIFTNSSQNFSITTALTAKF